MPLFITLVPKKVNPLKMGDFGPISCCNLIYKCITKLLANRLVSCLDILGSPIKQLLSQVEVLLKMCF